MSWLVPSLPSIPGWSRSTPAGPSTTKQQPPEIEEDGEDPDLDLPPSFPLADSAQRSQAPTPPTFQIAPPSPPREIEDERPSDLNIAILPDAVPLGNMAPPPSTTVRPTFGIQSADTPKAKVKGKKGKVALGPGYSALDWARLCGSGQNLRGTAIPMRVTMAELKKHNTEADAWSVFNGKVYNLTPYLPFHPGGVEELMRVAGRDGTKLFMLTHSWVNMEYMMQECMVGFLVKG